MKRPMSVNSKNLRIRSHSLSLFNFKQVNTIDRSAPKFNKQNSPLISNSKQFQSKLPTMKVQKADSKTLKSKCQSNAGSKNQVKKKLILSKGENTQLNYINQIYYNNQENNSIKITLHSPNQVKHIFQPHIEEFETDSFLMIANAIQMDKVTSNQDEFKQNQSFIKKNQIQKYSMFKRSNQKNLSYDPIKYKQYKQSIQIQQKQQSVFNNWSLQREKNRHLALSNLTKNQKFQIARQFSINVHHKIQSLDAQVQTSSYNGEDKFFMQYVKYRTLKIKSFDDIEQKYQKLKFSIQEGQKFNKNYGDLIDYIQRLPENNRQERVFALSNTLQQQEQCFRNNIKNFIKATQKQSKTNLTKIKQYQHKKSILSISIEHLLELCSKQFNRSDPDGKYCRILQRVIKQNKRLSKYNINQFNHSFALLSDIEVKIQQLDKSYQQWTKLLLQNRVLLYNFFKQIETVPAMTISLFGQQKNQFFPGFISEQTAQMKIQKYMSIKCEQCYDYKQKMKYIQFKNFQIKPIIKSLEWLLRDASKKKSVFALI